MKRFVRCWWVEHDTPEFAHSIISGTMHRMHKLAKRDGVPICNYYTVGWNYVDIVALRGVLWIRRNSSTTQKKGLRFFDFWSAFDLWFFNKFKKVHFHHIWACGNFFRWGVLWNFFRSSNMSCSEVWNVIRVIENVFLDHLGHVWDCSDTPGPYDLIFRAEESEGCCWKVTFFDGFKTFISKLSIKALKAVKMMDLNVDKWRDSAI